MGKKLTDLTGKKFGRWTVLSFCQTGRSRAHWNCKCQCGVEKIVKGQRMVDGDSKSCGCWRSEYLSILRTTHGESENSGNTPEYITWKSMKERCLNPNLPEFNMYGGRGISVCESWMRYENFLRDMGRRPSKSHSIDRINGDGNYEPSNCRWATKKQQSENRKNTIKITIDGETMIASQLESRLGFKPNLISRRILMGWTPSKSVLTPVRKYQRSQNA